MTASALTYEDLRKQARHLENDIDLKLVAFSKLGAGLKTHHASADKVPLLSDEDTFDTMSLEIEDLLQKLSSINERMAEQPVSGAAMLHTLHRHRDILADLSRDFRKTNSQHEQKLAREDLLRSNRPDYGRPGQDSGINRRDQYLKENMHIHSSDRLVNEQIAIAMETRDNLTSQRHSFKKLQTKFNDITNRFPVINSLVQRINLRKRRDSIIIGLVVSGCTLLLLFYAFH